MWLFKAASVQSSDVALAISEACVGSGLDPHIFLIPNKAVRSLCSGEVHGIYSELCSNVSSDTLALAHRWKEKTLFLIEIIHSD